MKKISKTILVTFVIVLCYYGVSVFFSVSGEFIRYSYIESLSIEGSKEKDVFYSDELDIILENDYMENQDDVVVWLNKVKKNTFFGLIELGFETEVKNYRSVNVFFKNENIRVQFENNSLMTKNSFIPKYYKIGDVAIISLYKNKNQKIGELKILID